MPIEPFQHIPLGRTGLTTTRLGLGGASIGGLFRPVADADAVALVDHAWSLGIRSFDVAPLYGYGAAERRMGAALARRPRDEFVLSTKVGRLVRASDAIAPGADVDRQSDGTRDDAYYAGTEGRRIVFDYSADGVRRSVEESLERLGLDRVDILYIHDPDEHWEAALSGAYPALERLRSEGTVRAIGAGMNQAAMLARFADETDMDVFMVAGRYTLLDQAALPELLPRCVAKGIAVMVVGVMNSGVLADPGSGAHFDYQPAPGTIVDRVRRLTEVCDRHGVPLRAAAIQFSLAHPAVVGLIAGVRTRRPPRRLPRRDASAHPDRALGRAPARGTHPARGARAALTRAGMAPRPEPSAAGHRREEDQGVGLADGRVERLQVAHIGVIEERVDEPVQLAVGREDLGLQRGVGGHEAGHDLAHGPARDLDDLGAAGGRAQRRWDADRAHAAPPGPAEPPSQASNAARLGRMTGASPGSPGRAMPSARPNVRASGVFSPFPVSSATTSSPSPMTPRRRAAATAPSVTPPAVSG